MKASKLRAAAALPWHPAPYEDADASAIKALAAGTASAAQQQRALDWIVHKACATYDLSFRPGEGGERDSAFAEGKRFVGLQVVKMARAQPRTTHGT
jgi:hypothetical protein